MRGESRGRRRFLAGVGGVLGVAVAGCGSLPWAETGSTTHFAPSEADAVLTESVPEPTRPVPVEPASSALADERSRVDDLLADVPAPVDPETVPNGVVRSAIDDRRATAVEHRDDAADATGDERYHALWSMRNARESARASAATLAAIDDDALSEELSAERDAVRSTVADRREAIAYRGADGADGRLRAALFAADLEDDLGRAARRLRRWDVDQYATVVEIGEGAGSLEFAAATTAAWDHLRDRYDESIADPVDLEPAFAAALEASVDRADGVALPDQGDDDWLAELVEGDLEQGFPQTLLWEAARPVYRARDALRAADADARLGTGLSEALRFEVEFRALERVRDRFEDGAVASPDSVEEIRSERAAAIAAADAALERLTRPSLGAALVADALQSVEWTDDAVRRSADADPDTVVSLGGEYGEYVCHRARFEVLPEAVSAFRERLLEQ